MKSILITGGLGYLGGRIVSALSQSDQYDLRISSSKKVVAVPGWLKREQIVSLDLTNEQECLDACRGVSCIIHLAAMNEIDSQNDPVAASEVNCTGTLKLLRAAETAKVVRFIYFSTAHVYGSPLAGSITEAALPRPVHPYAITHRAAEDFILAAHDLGRITGIVLRLSNGIGAPAFADVKRWTLIGNDLCRQAILNHELTLRTSGFQQRDFICMSDIISAVRHFIDIPRNDCQGGLFNLGGKNSMRIIDLAQIISDRCNRILGYAPPIHRPDSVAGERLAALDYRIDRLLSTGFNLKGDMLREIDETIELCRQAFVEL